MNELQLENTIGRRGREGYGVVGGEWSEDQAEEGAIWPPVCIQREMSSPRLETPKWT